ncbi:hypothetical protein ACTA71_002269 [Dictyostelium dimigraforme]
MNKYLLLVISLIVIGGVKSDPTLDSCVFKTSEYSIDLSPLKNNNWMYSAYNSEYNRNYTYSISVCSKNVFCQNSVTYIDGTQSCQKGFNTDFEIGNIYNGSYVFNPNQQSSIEITYLNSQKQGTPGSKCGNGYRSSSYSFKCSPNDIFSIYDFKEDPKCFYKFYILSKYACQIPNPTQTPSITPTATPSITPAPSTKVSCRVTNSNIIVNSPNPIICNATGPTICTSTGGSTCSTDDIYSKIKCSSQGPSISCTGSNIQCETKDTECSIDLNNYSGLRVNNIVIGADIYDSSLNITISNEKETSFGTTINVSLIFSVMLIILSLLF